MMTKEIGRKDMFWKHIYMYIYIHIYAHTNIAIYTYIEF